MLRALEVLLLPPLAPLLLAAVAVLVRRWRRAWGNAILAVALALMIAASLPVTGVALLCTLQSAPLDLARLPRGAQAIVVLSADMDVGAPECGGQTVGPFTMQRLRYAALLHKQTGLPLLVSGGHLPSHTEAHATTMQRVLERELGVTARWCEDKSHTTHENARFAATLLRDAGLSCVFLVTHAWHMPRASACFARQGITAIPAPTAFARWPTDPLVAWLPRWSGQRDVALAMHEWLGRAYYALFERSL